MVAFTLGDLDSARSSVVVVYGITVLTIRTQYGSDTAYEISSVVGRESGNLFFDNRFHAQYINFASKVIISLLKNKYSYI